MSKADGHTPDQNQAHLQQELDLGLDHVLVAVVKKLRAVTCRCKLDWALQSVSLLRRTALKDECLAKGDILQALLEIIDLQVLLVIGHINS